MCLVGCDHVVPVDAALMTPEGVAGYERTEAYEWAKRKGNPNAAIPSLQPFKLMYAMLLADMGLDETRPAVRGEYSSVLRTRRSERRLFNR